MHTIFGYHVANDWYRQTDHWVSRGWISDCIAEANRVPLSRYSWYTGEAAPTFAVCVYLLFPYRDSSRCWQRGRRLIHPCQEVCVYPGIRCSPSPGTFSVLLYLFALVWVLFWDGYFYFFLIYWNFNEKSVLVLARIVHWLLVQSCCMRYDVVFIDTEQ